ncbi:IclR family transcriptional regulator domain-containing protein [Candidimonas nitroreducens]|uniref:IclR family transcriptional regulator n=1 Tax=Candidimonas nitroreducens TaxID=683354 RepID=A0A225MJU0_9BURK|nr:IclR family transcriptional regulator C-terminal domain-containing protein [Candidimonas nitroreducens]OWT59179.1 IclR family transcriptional regulator [Candidimonas nitroreducens]
MRTTDEQAVGESWIRDHVQSLERGLAVICCLGTSKEMTLTQVAEATAITRAAARRFLLTLERLGYVGRTDRGYRLLPRTLELGYAYLSSQELPQIAQPYLQQLASELDESCGVSVLDQDAILYIARVTVSRLVGANLRAGSTLPAYCTAAGRILLAALGPSELANYLKRAKLEPRAPHTITDPKVLAGEIEVARTQGWYLIDQEIEHGIRSVAMPIRDTSGKTIAAVNVSSYSTRVSLTQLHRKFLPRIRQTVEKIEAELHSHR